MEVLSWLRYKYNGLDQLSLDAIRLLLNLPTLSLRRTYFDLVYFYDNVNGSRSTNLIKIDSRRSTFVSEFPEVGLEDFINLIALKTVLLFLSIELNLLLITSEVQLIFL